MLSRDNLTSTQVTRAVMATWQDSRNRMSVHFARPKDGPMKTYYVFRHTSGGPNGETCETKTYRRNCSDARDDPTKTYYSGTYRTCSQSNNYDGAISWVCTIDIRYCMTRVDESMYGRAQLRRYRRKIQPSYRCDLVERERCMRVFDEEIPGINV